MSRTNKDRKETRIYNKEKREEHGSKRKMDPYSRTKTKQLND